MIKLFCAILLFGLAALLADTAAEATQVQGGPDSAGGVCHVVQGSNKGKTGTYDGDGSCCNDVHGGWGCTDCNGSHAGYCKDGPAKSVGSGNTMRPSSGQTLQKSP